MRAKAPKRKPLLLLGGGWEEMGRQASRNEHRARSPEVASGAEHLGPSSQEGGTRPRTPAQASAALALESESATP